MVFHSRQVHSLMMSSHRFLFLPLRLPPWTVPCRTVLASPDDRVTCPYHFRSRLFTEARSSYASSSGFHFLIGYVISVRDTEEFSKTSHLQCLYHSFSVCSYCPRFTSIRKYGHGQGTHQLDLGADGDVLILSFQMTFSLVTAAVVQACIPLSLL